MRSSIAVKRSRLSLSTTCSDDEDDDVTLCEEDDPFTDKHATLDDMQLFLLSDEDEPVKTTDSAVTKNRFKAKYPSSLIHKRVVIAQTRKALYEERLDAWIKSGIDSEEVLAKKYPQLAAIRRAILQGTKTEVESEQYLRPGDDSTDEASLNRCCLTLDTLRRRSNSFSKDWTLITNWVLELEDVLHRLGTALFETERLRLLYASEIHDLQVDVKEAKARMDEGMIKQWEEAHSVLTCADHQSVRRIRHLKHAIIVKRDTFKQFYRDLMVALGNIHEKRASQGQVEGRWNVAEPFKAYDFIR